MLDADSLLAQAEMFMAPDAFKRFRHFYQEQVEYFFSYDLLKSILLED